MRVQLWQVGCALLAAFGATSATAQTNIYGMNVRLGQFFSSDTATFVSSYTNIATNTDPIFALDFDATATTLWGVNNTTMEYGTFDLTMGTFTPLGTVVGPVGASGLTAAADGTTWYLCEYDSATGNANLWAGDVTTGTFAPVGVMAATLMIDITIDSTGNLYGHSISTDSLYSIDTTTGAATVIGPTGLNANYAQGMDFDWTDDTLYATIYTGGGTGQFCSLDLTTGAATLLEDTVSLNAEMEIACEAGIGGGEPGVAYCFGDGSGTACPCANNNDGSLGGAGCDNGVFASGAQLGGSGTASLSNDTLVLSGINLEPSNSGLYFQADNDLSPGNIWGDGLQCAGGALKRLGVRFADANGASDTSGFATSISVKAGNILAGDTKRYQLWYRTTVNPPCGLGVNDFNSTNGYAVTWAP